MCTVYGERSTAAYLRPSLEALLERGFGGEVRMQQGGVLGQPVVLVRGDSAGDDVEGQLVIITAGALAPIQTRAPPDEAAAFAEVLSDIEAMLATVRFE